MAAIRSVPAKWLAKLLEGARRWAAMPRPGLLFTSGSSGEPKGVVLSHRNILGNCLQIDASQSVADRREDHREFADFSQLWLHRDAVVPYAARLPGGDRAFAVGV